MVPRPSVSRQDDAAQQADWDELVKLGPPVLYIAADTRGLRSHGDDEVIFIPKQPYDPLSEAAQDTGRFFAAPSDLVDVGFKSGGIIGSNRPLCGACCNALLYFHPLRRPKSNRARSRQAADEETSEAGEEDKPGGDQKNQFEATEGQDENTGGEAPSKPRPAAVVHHGDLVSYSASVEAGCSLCKRLRGPLDRFNRDLRPEDVRLELHWGQLAKESPRSSLYFIFTRIKDARGPYNFVIYYRMHAYPSEHYAALFKSPIAELQVSGDNTGSPRCRELARHWLNTCHRCIDERHLQCSVHYPEWAPARLLDAGSARTSGTLRLVPKDHVPKHDSYITLSYVWGAEGPKHLPLLQSSNIEQRQDTGVAVAELPKTLRDAIEVTGWFNVRWLWIDCMCILQDSTTDWNNEADTMSMNYRNAVLNISADASGDARGGCFSERDPADVEAWQLSSDLGAWHILPHHKYVRAEADATLSYWRAWIFREWQLARRVLHFTPKELVWECCGTGLASETYPGGAPFAPFDATFGGQAKHQWLSRDGTIMEQGMSRQALHESWNILCDAFSSRHLTKRSDMPLIISTLAADFEYRLPGDTYMSGLWMSQLPHCLLWTTTTVRPGNLPDRVEDVMAATWSWLWTGNAVELRPRYRQLPVLRPQTLNINESVPSTHSLRVCRLGCTGIVREIRVTLAQEITAEEYYDGDFLVKIELADDEKRLLGASRDPDEGDMGILTYDGYVEAQTCRYHCLFVNIQRLSESPSINGLLLKFVNQTNGKRCFRRVGTVTFYGLMALKVRYRVRFGRSSGEQQWKQLARAFDTTQEHTTTYEDADVDGTKIDPAWLYRYDTEGDFSWLKRLKPEEVELV